MIDLTTKLATIGLKLPEEALRSLVQHAEKKKLSHSQMLEHLVEIETRERDSRNLQRRSRAATLGSFKTIDQFDWNHPRSIERDLYESLYESLQFIPRGENVLLRGQAGVGKTTLAQNLGHRALHRGYAVRFSSLSAALADLLRQESIPATERRLKRYIQPDLLILDELGYVPCDARAADLFFRIISRRHESRSVVITTNLGFKHWGSMFHDAQCLSALIDRFAQHCHVIDIDADSWRDKQRQERKTKTAKKGR
jgi:DNA replication protein DnaC